MIKNTAPGHEAEFLIYAALLLLLGFARFTEGGRLQMFLRSFLGHRDLPEGVRARWAPSRELSAARGSSGSIPRSSQPAARSLRRPSRSLPSG